MRLSSAFRAALGGNYSESGVQSRRQETLMESVSLALARSAASLLTIVESP